MPGGAGGGHRAGATGGEPIMTPEIREERLRQLRRVGQDSPDERFDMQWFGKVRAHDCGTVHCASGWFALDPWAQANTEILEIFDVSQGKDGGTVKQWTQCCEERHPDYEMSGTFVRLATLFGITPLD